MDILNNILLLVLDASPYLLLGFMIAGLVKTFLSEELIQKTLGKNDVKTVALASLIGAPVPLCSCGVIPVVQGIKKQGASKGATIAFLVSTPETGVDSVAMTYGMMGPGMAILRPVFAVLTAFFAGIIELFLFKDEEIVAETHSCCSSKQEEVVKEESSCCASKQEEVIKEESSCCSSDEKKSLSTTEEAGLEKENKSSKNINSESFTSRLAKGLKYSFVNLLRDISPTLLFAFVLGGIISTVLSEELVSHYFHGGISGYIGIVLLSVPMYICATSSTPIAAAFMMKGMSPGTALVFLMAGPATNFTSLSILSKIFGAKSIASYLTVIILSSICFGLLTDYLILKQLFTVQLSLQHMHEHNMSASPIQVALTVIFMVPVFYYSFQAFQEKYLKS